DWRGEGWSEPGDPARLAAAYQGWAPELLDVISAIETPFRWALFDRAPLTRWSEGRVTLTGDACHPMLPSLAQGACQALEDAISLAAHLDGASDIPAALNRHYAARIGRVSRVQEEARANLKRFHRDDAATAAAIRLAALAAPGWFMRRLDWLYAA
ncbi:MAG: FAD-dependent monooxygenase, partial [Paracoccaceae bacterium]